MTFFGFEPYYGRGIPPHGAGRLQTGAHFGKIAVKVRARTRSLAVSGRAKP